MGAFSRGELMQGGFTIISLRYGDIEKLRSACGVGGYGHFCYELLWGSLLFCYVTGSFFNVSFLSITPKLSFK